jgi:Cof subfamily protein (haloacid dehalogenase superfamily)
MRKRSPIYLFCDIDGTLGIAGQGIPRRNVDAIRRFVERGGYFALSTGRWITDIKHFVREIPINGLSIINNGAALYDFGEDRCVVKQYLHEEARRYVLEILEEFPRIGLLAVNESGYFSIDTNSGRLPGIDGDPRRFPVRQIEQVQGPYLKFLFGFEEGSPNMIPRLIGGRFPGVRLVQSSDRCVEMVPEGVSKGAALQTLCRMQNIPVENTAFIGDNYNDREMFQAARFTACVDTTPHELHPLCDLVLGGCMDGAVADFIDLLENR